MLFFTENCKILKHYRLDETMQFLCPLFFLFVKCQINFCLCNSSCFFFVLFAGMVEPRVTANWRKYQNQSPPSVPSHSLHLTNTDHPFFSSFLVSMWNILFALIVVFKWLEWQLCRNRGWWCKTCVCETHLLMSTQNWVWMKTSSPHHITSHACDFVTTYTTHTHKLCDIQTQKQTAYFFYQMHVFFCYLRAGKPRPHLISLICAKEPHSLHGDSGQPGAQEILNI